MACPINFSYSISYFCTIFHICFVTPAKESSTLHSMDTRSSQKEVDAVHWEAGRDSSNVLTFCFPFPYSTAFHILLVSKLLDLKPSEQKQKSVVTMLIQSSEIHSLLQTYCSNLSAWESAVTHPAQQGHCHLIIIIKPHAATQTWLSWSIPCPSLSPSGKSACSLLTEA